MRLKALSLFGAALLAFGCQSDNGGQSGDFSGQDGEGGPATGGSNCEDTETPIDTGDDSQLGFSADEVIAVVSQGFTAPMAWQSVVNVGYAPGSGSTELTITAAPTGEAWYVTSVPKNQDGAGPAIAVVCSPPRLRIAVDVQVSSADGALNESFSSEIDAASTTIMHLTQSFELDEIAGSFAIESLPEGGELLGLGLDVTLSKAGMTGSLGGLLQITYAAGDPLEGAVSGQGVTFASWPDGVSCPPDDSGQSGIPVAVEDEALGLSGQAALELYNAATPVSVRWLDGSESELTLTATAAGGGCMRLNPYAAYSPEEPEASVAYPVTLHALSDDGALDGTYAAVLTTSPRNDSEEQRVVVDVSLPLELGQLAESGLDGITLPDGLHRLFYTLTSGVRDGAANGWLRLNGLTDPPCVTDPPEPEPGANSAPGCEGTQVTELAKGSWGTGVVD
jgi:hypothetical protein